MTSFDFDPTLYVRSPRGDVPTMLALARALDAAAPKKASPGVVKASRRVRRAAAKLERTWARRKQSFARVDKRVVDRRIDAAWSALKARLDGLAGLGDKAPEARRAAALLDTLFPEGLGFTKLPFAAEWAESEQRLQRIDEEDLADEIAELASKSVLTELRRAHEEYGKVLGITQPIDRPPIDSVTEPLRDLVRAIGDYGLQVAAMADADDPASVLAVRAALAPMDETRASAATRGGASTPDAAGGAGSNSGDAGGDAPEPPPAPAEAANPMPRSA